MLSSSILFRLLQIFPSEKQEPEDLKGPVAGAGIKAAPFFSPVFHLTMVERFSS